MFLDDTENLPPDSLLEVVTDWVSKSTNLCTAALSCPEPALPQGGIPMPPITPFAGLFRLVKATYISIKIKKTKCFFFFFFLDGVFWLHY